MQANAFVPWQRWQLRAEIPSATALRLLLPAASVGLRHVLRRVTDVAIKRAHQPITRRFAAMEPSSLGASPRKAAMSKGSPKTRRPKKSPSSTSRLSSGRRGPKVVNFKSPPRAVFKSSAAARQACAPDTAVRNLRALSTLPSHLRRLWQAVVTCLPLSDKAASAHVAALSHCQRYEPTGTATCPVERHALGLSLRLSLIHI